MERAAAMLVLVWCVAGKVDVMPWSEPAWYPPSMTTFDYARVANAAYDLTKLTYDETTASGTLAGEFADVGPHPTPYRLVAQFEDGEAQAIMLYDTFGDELLVAFRGTESPGDVMADLRAKPVPYTFQNENAGEGGGMQVHDGFYEQYRALRAAILERVDQHPTAKLTTTGHSLGGALATLAALDLAANYGKVRNVRSVTFGSPRVGNKAFAEAYRAHGIPTHRVINRCLYCLGMPPGQLNGGRACQDKVSLVPTEAMDFEHVCDWQLAYHTKATPNGALDPVPVFELALHSLTSYEKTVARALRLLPDADEL